MKHAHLLFILVLNVFVCQAQSDILELNENDEEETQVLIAERNELRDELRNHPLDLNKDNLEPMITAGLINESQIRTLKEHIADHGSLLSINELQTIDGFDLPAIRKLQPFITVSNQVSHKVFALEKTNQSITLKAGYRRDASDTFLRSMRTIAAYRFRSKQLNAGLLAENDAGEKYSSTTGSFTSCFIQLKRTGIIRSIVAGDYNISAGQGLNIWTGYAINTRSDALSARRSQSLLTPHTGTDENRFFRGLSVHMQYGKFQLLLFGSSRSYLKINAPPLYSRLATTSFSELSAGSSGGNLFYRSRTLEAGITFCSTSLDRRIGSSEELYKRFHFTGRKSNSASAYYSFYHSNLCFFGENALSDQLQFASLNGILISAGKSASLSIRHNYAAPGYNSFYSSWNGIRRDARNENSLAFMLNIACRRNIKFSASLRSFKSPWIKYGEQTFSAGTDLYISAARELPDKGYLKLTCSAADPSRLTEELRNIRNTIKISYGLRLFQLLTFATSATYSSLIGTDLSSHALSGELHYEQTQKLRFILAAASVHAESSVPVYHSEEGVSSFANPVLSNGDFIRLYLLTSFTINRKLQLKVKAEQTSKNGELSVPGFQLLLRSCF